MSDRQTMPCPACREAGSDKSGDHLTVFPSGKFACAVHPGDKAHNRRIFELNPELKEVGVSIDTPTSPVSSRRPLPKQRLRKVKEYHYHDAEGNVLYRVIRYVNDSDEKTFKQGKLTGSGWEWTMQNVSRVPYRLPDVIKAKTVWVVEGEKDADNLDGIGITATTNAGGAGKWDASWSHYFAGKDIVLCGDDDEPGRKHMDQVEAALRPVAKSIRRVVPTGEKVKDISDLLEGLSNTEAVAEVEKLLLECDVSIDTSKPTLKDWHDVREKPVVRPQELITGILYRGSKMSLGGSSKSNKTWSLMDMALSVATGSRWWNIPTVRAKVAYIDLELEEWAFTERVHQILKARALDPERGQFQFINLRGKLSEWSGFSRSLPDDLGLIVLDPIYKLMAGLDENKAGDIASIMGDIEALSVRTGAAVVFGAHYSKGNQAGKQSIDRVSGSGVFARDPDSIISLTAHEEEGCFTVEPVLRYFPPCAPFAMRWNFPLMERDESLDPMKLKQAGGRPAKHRPETLLELVRKPVTGQEWKQLADEAGIPRSTYYELRAELARSGKVEQAKSGDVWMRK